MLTKQLEKLKDHISTSYKPFPSVHDRVYWESAPDTKKNMYITAAVKYLEYDFPAVKATKFMEFHRTGNRSGYQEVYNERRYALNIAMLAELFENKGRFIDLMIDMIWLICEETTWIIPAHNAVGGYKHLRLPLADFDRPIIDLMSADTACSIALACYFLKSQFDAVTPQICTRTKYELTERIIKPYRNHTDYWWMGFMQVGDEQLNNWNPWINSNVLMVLLLTEDNPGEKYYILHKLTESLDRYIDAYPDDGGCDEGPGYWGRAGASVFECLEILLEYSEGKVNIFNNQKIKNMCKFIYRAHISGAFFLNFADASPRANTDPTLIFRFGKHINDPVSMAFAAYLYKNVDDQNTYLGRFGNMRPIRELDSDKEITDFKQNYIPEKSVFLDDIQVACFRENSANGEIFLAVKGGNNFENHNHNDIGNFIVYGNGKPFIIDAGSMVYTKKTFSPYRYDIWTNCSLWHNVPEVNNTKQLCGSEFKANNTTFTEKGGISTFKCEIQDAYPRTSGIVAWERSASLNRNNQTVWIDDSFELDKSTDKIRLSLICLPEPVIDGNTIYLSDGDTKMQIIAGENMSVDYELIELTDKKHKIDWGEKMYRISLNLKETVKTGKLNVKINLI